MTETKRPRLPQLDAELFIADGGLETALIFLDRDKAPLTIGIRNLLGQYANEWHLLAAGAFVTMIARSSSIEGFAGRAPTPCSSTRTASAKAR